MALGDECHWSFLELSCQSSKQCADLLEQEPYFRYNGSISFLKNGNERPCND
ncbi:hypothetical protein DB29_00951 [Shouchella clausii]|nr:hypothetical protein DB29_00951 [Shouchella clausii]